MLGFINTLFSFPVPLWGVLVIMTVLSITGYFVLRESLQMFAPTVANISRTIVEENTATSTQQLMKIVEQIEALQSHILKTEEILNKRLNTIVNTYEEKMHKGRQTMMSVYDLSYKRLEKLESVSEELLNRVETIKSLESEIIKLKQIIKRRR